MFNLESAKSRENLFYLQRTTTLMRQICLGFPRG